MNTIDDFREGGKLRKYVTKLELLELVDNESSEFSESDILTNLMSSITHVGVLDNTEQGGVRLVAYLPMSGQYRSGQDRSKVGSDLMLDTEFVQELFRIDAVIPVSIRIETDPETENSSIVCSVALEELETALPQWESELEKLRDWISAWPSTIDTDELTYISRLVDGQLDHPDTRQCSVLFSNSEYSTESHPSEYFVSVDDTVSQVILSFPRDLFSDPSHLEGSTLHMGYNTYNSASLSNADLAGVVKLSLTPGPEGTVSIDLVKAGDPVYIIRSSETVEPINLKYCYASVFGHKEEPQVSVTIEDNMFIMPYHSVTVFDYTEPEPDNTAPTDDTQAPEPEPEPDNTAPTDDTQAPEPEQPDGDDVSPSVLPLDETVNTEDE